ncbi:hypothetical protein HPB48_011766 [Haemaphysalis longicornis]|uniref:Medium-chain acyl-CoA ligase ACSF2, mitochondrial n=1 Tax=Haemaphysalis longicornis TaxID=44386 RepID=A0A9J6H0W8_HAELO|nr:hypothetical protein HPB48_011766 [Haemaphysalis longicornis]
MTFPVHRRADVGLFRRRSLGSLSYCHTPGKQPLHPFTIGDLVDRAADKHGDSVAIVSCHQSLRKTYAEYKADIDRFASALVSLNLPFGSKVAIMAPNMYEWGVTQFASAKAGLVLVNLNPAFQVPELEYCLNHVSVAAIFNAFALSDFDYFENRSFRIHKN